MTAQAASVKRRTAFIGLLLAIVFWGASFIAIKIALRELSPSAIAVARNSIGTLVLAAVVWRRGGLRRLPRRAVPGVVLLGFLGTAFHQWLQMTGLLTASATVTSWIIASIPVFVALLGWLFLHERLGILRLAGIGLAAVGVLTVISGGSLAALAGGRAFTSGDGLIVLSAVNWAVYTIVSKRYLGDRLPGQTPDESPIPAVTLLLYGFLAGCVFSAGWTVLDGGWRGLAEMSTAAWGALVFLGVACSGLAYLFWYDGLQAVDATQVGSFLYLEPLVTTALAAPLLGEPISAAILLGGGAILLGVWLVTRG